MVAFAATAIPAVGEDFVAFAISSSSHPVMAVTLTM